MLKRHSLFLRLVHWVNALCFALLVLTALGLLSLHHYERDFLGSFYFINHLFYSTYFSRLIHKVCGFAFLFSTMLLWLMVFKESEKVGPEDLQYLKARVKNLFSNPGEPLPPQGKYNATQKVFVLLSTFFSLGMFFSGVILLLPLMNFPWFLTLSTYIRIVHDLATIPFFLFILPHLYLSFIAYPESMKGMVLGKVSSHYAQKRHLKWFESQVKKG